MFAPVSFRGTVFLLGILVIPCAASSDGTSCQATWANPYPGGDLGGPVYAFAEFDADGAGPAPARLHAAGYIAAAGGLPAMGLAAWDGVAWSPVAGGVTLPPILYALELFDDDGPGPLPPALYVGGDFSYAGNVAANDVARWDGQAWSALSSGTDGVVWALATFDDDGPGPHPPALYVGGVFASAGGVKTPGIARWDGREWSAVGGGTIGTVFALCVFDDDGPGPMLPRLFAGGRFTDIGGVAANYVARWDGSQWSAVDEGMSDTVRALAVFDEDGDGPEPPRLFAGGDFLKTGGLAANFVAKWDGADWQPLAGGMNDSVYTLKVLDSDAAGPQAARLYAGGEFTIAGGVVSSCVATWDGATWQPHAGSLVGTVLALTVFDDDAAGPHPPELIAAGDFIEAEGKLRHHAVRWNGADWVHLGQGFSRTVRAVMTYALPVGDEESGLVAAGNITAAGSAYVSSIAQWTGRAWVGLGTGISGEVAALTVFDSDLAGPEPESLIAGGFFTHAGGTQANHVARWDGAAWSGLGTGLNGTVEALHGIAPGAGGALAAGLYAGGSFATAGGVNARCIARWDGFAWSAVGGGVSAPFGGPAIVRAIIAHDQDADGPTPPALYVGGYFTVAGSEPAKSIAHWNGSAWSALGSGIDGDVHAMASYDADQAGPARPILVVGGAFTQAGTTAANHVAAWNGVDWSALGAGLDGVVHALAVVDDDGAGPIPPVLIAGGDFKSAGSISAAHVARWTGIEWAPLAAGTTGCVRALSPLIDDASGEVGQTLWVGGDFGAAGDLSAAGLARWGRPTPFVRCQPMDQAVVEGGTATFTVVADGAAPLDYRWHRNGAPLAEDGRTRGVDSPCLNIEAVKLDEAGAYQVRIRNLCGATFSEPAMLAVSCSEPADGDMNGDRRTDGDDVPPFVYAVLSGQASPQAVCRGDFNRDRVVDVLDVPWFVDSMLIP